MTFGSPQFIYLLAALPLLGAFVWWALRQRKRAISRIGDPVLVQRLSLSASRRVRGLRVVLWFLGVFLLIVALARPQWGSDIQIVEQAGVQVMIALDVSRSMLAEDVKPTRLDRAKLEISDLISRLQGDEVGIVLFSGASFIQFPLTSDHSTAKAYLYNANPNAISRQGTVVAEAIDISMTGFSTERENQKIIVIMTDGEDHEGDPIAAARQAAAEGAVVFAVGLGSQEGSPVMEYDDQGNVSGQLRDTEGRAIISRMDEIALQQISESGGGRYFRASEPRVIAELADEIQAFQDRSLQSKFSQRKVERFQLFLLAGALCLVVAELLADRLFHRQAQRHGPGLENAGDA